MSTSSGWFKNATNISQPM